MKNFDILVFGDLCADFILTAKDIVPEFGQKEKLIDDYSLEMGGSGSIFACQASKLGLKTIIIGKLGDDLFGDLVYKTLVQSGVHTGLITRTTEMKTAVSTILNKGHDRAILTLGSTTDALTENDIPWDILPRVRHFHISSYFLMKKLQPCYPGVIRKLKENGATISIDTNWDPEEKWNGGLKEILPMVDIYFGNENEAMALTSQENLQDAITRLCAMIPVVVIKKGIDGAEAHFDGKMASSPAIPGEKADAVGAGDSFDAGFLYGYLKGLGIEQCLLTGNICGSLTTRFPGGTKGQPSEDILKKYM